MSREAKWATKVSRVFLWIARIFGLLFVALVLVIGITAALNPNEPSPTPREWVGIIFFPIGVCVGYVIGWRWQLLGGSVALGSFVAFFAWLVIERDGIRAWPVFVLFAIPGLLFVFSWFVSRRGGRIAASE